MKKTVAFFGDSFVGKYEGWLQHFCEIYGYECLHVGKPGADQFYSLEKWIEFNNLHEDMSVDLCVYAHTESHRLYHSDPKLPLTSGVVRNYTRMGPWTDEQKLVFKAAEQYYLYLYFSRIGDLKGIVVPMGIDQYINQNNKVFKKIIHIWGFAPIRMHDGISEDHYFARTTWPFEMISGMNIKLDLSNLSFADPNNKKQKIDSRPLHFSRRYSPFVSEILATAVKFYEKGRIIDFSPYIIQSNPTWEDYVDAFEQIKNKLNENINNG